MTLRPLTSIVPLNERGVRLSRRIVAGALALVSPALAGTDRRAVDGSAPAGVRVRGEWVRARRTCRDDAVILYVHGSGYAVCSARTHRGVTSRLSMATGLPVFACDYRLAPRHRFPAAAHDVRAAYDWLRAHGYSPDRIVLAGDSAGAHLAVDLVLELNRVGQQVPSTMVLFSPLVDPTLSLAREREKLRRDPMITAARARRIVELYTRDADPTDPRLTLRFTEGQVLPSTLIQAGGAEMLADDAGSLARSIRSGGGTCELQVWPDQMHVFQAFAAVLPEGRRAMRGAAEFVRAELGRAPQKRELTESA
ncbi:alpha/beta hydrolase [Haloechinothrix aidingensis]|uniref:alpha/beta hydrolase n=1 Tax=Haloechinothrix aidingensis TaxID=2752311 RepID=UPI0031B59C1E